MTACWDEIASRDRKFSVAVYFELWQMAIMLVCLIWATGCVTCSDVINGEPLVQSTRRGVFWKQGFQVWVLTHLKLESQCRKQMQPHWWACLNDRALTLVTTQTAGFAKSDAPIVVWSPKMHWLTCGFISSRLFAFQESCTHLKWTAVNPSEK